MIGSTDLKALYPSLDIPFTIEVVGEVFYNSNVNIAGVDNDELGLYISLTLETYGPLSESNGHMVVFGEPF